MVSVFSPPKNESSFVRMSAFGMLHCSSCHLIHRPLRAVLAGAAPYFKLKGSGDCESDHAAGLVSISQTIARTAAKAGKPKANHQRYSL